MTVSTTVYNPDTRRVERVDAEINVGDTWIGDVRGERRTFRVTEVDEKSVMAVPDGDGYGITFPRIDLAYAAGLVYACRLWGRVSPAWRPAP